MAKIQPQSVGLAPELPRHIGIIMDGNGRYATRRGLPRKLGHRAGMERLRGLIRFSSDIGIEVLSLYAFSTENWKRPKEEIGALFDLFLEYFISELDELDKNNVCIRIMGDMSAFPGKMGQETDEAMYKTRNNTGLKLNIALNYGSRPTFLGDTSPSAGIISASIPNSDMGYMSMNAEYMLSSVVRSLLNTLSAAMSIRHSAPRSIMAVAALILAARAAGNEATGKHSAAKMYAGAANIFFSVFL